MGKIRVTRRRDSRSLRLSSHHMYAEDQSCLQTSTACAKERKKHEVNLALKVKMYHLLNNGNFEIICYLLRDLIETVINNQNER